MTDERPRRRRSLDSLKKEAKRWLDALRANAVDARARLERALPNASATPTLRDVQHALAREHGFSGWAALKQALEQALASDRDGGSAGRLAQYETMAYRHIGECEQLESLILMYCRDTTDAATEHITGLRKLSYYFNSYTMITDRTPELLSGMDSLERITFDACHGLTNTGIARLARLPRLRELHVSGKAVTSDVVDAFSSRVSVLYGP